MAEQFEMNLSGTPESVPDEFAGMSADALRENIATQEKRLNTGLVDRTDKYEIEDLVERMKAKLAQMEG